MYQRKWSSGFLLLAASVFAPISYATPKSHFSGWYTGLSGGGVATVGEMNSATTVVFQNQFDTANQLASAQSSRELSTAGIGALTLGYGTFLDYGFHLGGEIFVNVAKRHTTLNDFAFHTQPNDDEDAEFLVTTTESKLHTWEFGLDILPGFLIDPYNLVYARFGAAFNEHSLESNTLFSFTTNQVVPSATFDSFLSTSDEKDRVGLRIGLGIEHCLCPNLTVTADYIYTYYGRVTVSGIADASGALDDGDGVPFFTPNGLVSSASSRLYTNAAMIGVKWYIS